MEKKVTIKLLALHTDNHVDCVDKLDIIGEHVPIQKKQSDIKVVAHVVKKVTIKQLALKLDNHVDFLHKLNITGQQVPIQC